MNSLQNTNGSGDEELLVNEHARAYALVVESLVNLREDEGAGAVRATAVIFQRESAQLPNLRLVQGD